MTPKEHVVSTTVRIPVSPGRVWDAITSPDELIQWYAPGCRWDIPALRDGATIRFFNTDTDIQVATIARCVAPESLVLHWTPDASLPNTVLVNSYELRPYELGTSVTLAQTGYDSVPDAERAAWIQADEAAFPAIAAALAVHLSANPSRSDG